MHFSTLLGLAAGAQAVSTGFNYGNQLPDGTFKDQATYEAEFKKAQSLTGTNGMFTSARLYTMIQADTDSDPTVAIQAAIDTQTTLLLGLWASVDQATFDNEITALKGAIQQYGTKFTDLVDGISVGSEDLYRVSPTGVENDSGVGTGPGTLVDYIKQTRDAIKGTSLSNAKVGHVDTWTAFVNETNAPVIDNIDWLGVDSYPYFQTTVANSIENGNKTFWDSYDETVSASKGKEVWITETGWPVTGPKSGDATAGTKNAETYWQEVGCELFSNYNTWWYTLEDGFLQDSDPKFSLVGNNIDSDPLYDLTCKASSKSSGSDSDGGDDNSSTGTQGTSSSTASGSGTAGSAAASSAVAANAEQDNAASQMGAAAGAGILAIVALMITL